MKGFKFPQSIKLARTPTPIEKLSKLSQELGGPEIYVKRDDLTGVELSGNKVRKLEFLAADAVSKGADTLITCGGIQSNHARATAIVATRLGMRSFLVLRGQEGSTPDGNLFLDYLAGAEVKFISPEEYETVDEIMEEVAEELRERGQKPYIIPEGASNEIGVLGYLKAMGEIKQQLEKQGLKIDHLITAVGSGGTLAGLLLGRIVFGLETEIYGINVCRSKEYFVDHIYEILNRAQRRYRLNLEFKKGDIKVIEGYVGRGYALSRIEEVKLIRKVAQMEGIFLDPVYTGKAMFGLLDQIKKGRFRKGERILFLHTGGIFGLFPTREMFFEE